MNHLANFWHLWGGWAMGAVLLAIAVGFALRFVLPALALGQDLERAIGSLRRLRAEGGAMTPERIANEAMASPRLAGQWREYAQTLHGVADARNPGKLAAWRSTGTAADFFTERVLVDTPLKTEFYKHLPGILTGIGIIGTFSGLIAGLTHFEVSSDAETVRLGLRGLIQGVGEAFKVSAAAIALAMAATWVEKTLLTRRYRQVEELVLLIDGFFDAGVGEEYLARLVRASEFSATQAGQLRKAIVGELRVSMEAMVARQQEIAAQQQELLAGKVATAVAQSVGAALKDPLTRMSGAVERLGTGQGQAMGEALERALNRFASQMDNGFGRRSEGQELLLQRTIAAQERLSEELGRLALRLEATAGGPEEIAPTADVVGRLEGAATALDRAGLEAHEYLENISEVLARAHAVFAENVERTLARGNGEFQHQVVAAVESLKGAIEELADALAQNPVSR